MKLKLDNVSLSIDIDPEDLSDDDLRQLVIVAGLRGISPPISGTAGELQLAIDRAFRSLMNNNVPMATAQLSPFISAEKRGEIISGAIAAQIGGRRAAMKTNGHAPKEKLEPYPARPFVRDF